MPIGRPGAPWKRRSNGRMRATSSRSRATAADHFAVPLRDAGFAPAKVNLTLHVLGRRADGYHEIESLVVFADVGDQLAFAPGDTLALDVGGPTAGSAGAAADNLVLKAARALAERVEGLRLGR